MKGQRKGRNFRGGGKPRRPGPPNRRPQNPSQLTLQRLEGDRYTLVPPECALDRDLDLEEVHSMRDGGEPEIARDELLYLVADCRGFLEAHNLLGELALEEEDIPLARGHFGFAYECGLAALPERFRGVLPAAAGYNPHFFAAGRGLARCLIAKGDLRKGREVLEQLAKFDPQEPVTQDLLLQLKERTAGQIKAAGSTAPAKTRGPQLEILDNADVPPASPRGLEEGRT